MIDKSLLNPRQITYLEKCDKIRKKKLSTPWTKTFVEKFCHWIENCSEFQIMPFSENDRKETFGLSHPELKDLNDILSGRSHEMNLIRYLMGKSLGELVIAGNSEQLKILKLYEQWDVSEGFADVLLDNLEKPNVMKFCNYMIQWLNRYSYKSIVGNNEKSLFKNFYSHWKKQETDINSLWENNWQNFYSHENCVEILAILVAKKPDIFAPVVNRIQNPLIATNLFFSLYITYDFDLLKKLLSILPSCIQRSGMHMPKWNHSVVLIPLLLPFLIHSAQELSTSDCENFCKECGKILLDRNDGLFLAWNYIPQLHFMATFLDNHQKQIALTFLESIVEYMENADKVKTCCEWISEKYGKTFLDSTEGNFKTYLETGQLTTKKEGKMLDEIVSFCRLLPNEVLASESGNILLEAYRRCWAFEEVLSTSSSISQLPDMSHDAICSLYVNSKTPAQNWLKDAQQLISPALFRIIYARNSGSSANLNFEINFHLAVGWQLACMMYELDNQKEFKETVLQVSTICQQLYWLHKQYPDNFYCRILANLGMLEYFYAQKKGKGNNALTNVQKFIKKLPGIRHLPFEIFERLHTANELNRDVLTASSSFISLYKNTYKNELEDAKNEHWNINKREARIAQCQKRLKELTLFQQKLNNIHKI